MLSLEPLLLLTATCSALEVAMLVVLESIR